MSAHHELLSHRLAATDAGAERSAAARRARPGSVPSASRLEELKAAVAGGRYRVDPALVAEAMLSSTLRQEPGRSARRD